MMHLNDRSRLRTVALIDVIKGVVILAIALGILSAHSHVLENGGVSLLRLLELDPTQGAPLTFLEFLNAADKKHGLLLLAAVIYAALRFVEAYGLWFVRNWARWLGLISAGVYVPVELYYFIKKPGWTTFGVMLINLVVLWLLWPRQRKYPTEPTRKLS